MSEPTSVEARTFANLGKMSHEFNRLADALAQLAAHVPADAKGAVEELLSDVTTLKLNLGLWHGVLYTALREAARQLARAGQLKEFRLDAIRAMVRRTRERCSPEPLQQAAQQIVALAGKVQQQRQVAEQKLEQAVKANAKAQQQQQQQQQQRRSAWGATAARVAAALATAAVVGAVVAESSVIVAALAPIVVVGVAAAAAAALGGLAFAILRSFGEKLDAKLASQLQRELESIVENLVRIHGELQECQATTTGKMLPAAVSGKHTLEALEDNLEQTKDVAWIAGALTDAAAALSEHADALGAPPVASGSTALDTMAKCGHAAAELVGDAVLSYPCLAGAAAMMTGAAALGRGHHGFGPA